MLPDRVSIPGPLTYESGALPTALSGPAYYEQCQRHQKSYTCVSFLLALGETNTQF